MDSYDYGFVQREYTQRLDQSEQVLRAQELQVAATETLVKLPALDRILTAMGRCLTAHTEVVAVIKHTYTNAAGRISL